MTEIYCQHYLQNKTGPALPSLPIQLPNKIAPEQEYQKGSNILHSLRLFIIFIEPRPRNNCCKNIAKNKCNFSRGCVVQKEGKNQYF